jgi:hypothetical protein
MTVLAAVVKDRPTLSSERMLHKEYSPKCSAEKKNTGHGSQGAWRKDELIGSKLPVIK